MQCTSGLAKSAFMLSMHHSVNQFCVLHTQDGILTYLLILSRYAGDSMFRSSCKVYDQLSAFHMQRLVACTDSITSMLG